jgi:hypothetical protein
MPKGPKDFSQAAFDLVARSTGTPTTEDLAKTERAAKGAEARAEALSPERRSEIAKTAAKKRWGGDSGPIAAKPK